MTIPFSIVHHANQYIITEGYENREGILTVLGAKDSTIGLWRILELHRTYNVPASLHINGTLLEAIAWHQPAFLNKLREMYAEGLLDFVGSCYGQNIMRFFGYEHNLKQLNEELLLYRIHLGIDPQEVKVFWPPERVWDTARMAPVLRDSRLLNGGYKYVILDDRVLLPAQGNCRTRDRYDQDPRWDPELFQMYRIKHGQGLCVLPIARNLRHSIPPRGPENWHCIKSQLQWLSALGEVPLGGAHIAIYADDMEKPAGVGWDPNGPGQFEALLAWISENPWVRPVKLGEWAPACRPADTKEIEAGTFVELAKDFEAGENYEKWYFDARWSPYRDCFLWSEGRVRELAALGADASLIELAQKHLLASCWETAWHTPAAGAHGNPHDNGGPSAWARALASHSRHAAVIAEAALWMRHADDEAHAYLYDIDRDGDAELILKNDKLFAVLSPRRGGRLLYLFHLDGPGGKMVIGNPTDDWNLQEELNHSMDVPRNHPGALADVGFEHDSYEATVFVADGPAVFARLENKRGGSRACGLAKNILLSQGESALQVDYVLPEALSSISIEFGLSPDYLSLLRYGRTCLRDYVAPGVRGWAVGGAAVWVRPEDCPGCIWDRPSQAEFGHGRLIRLSARSRRFRMWVGAGPAATEATEQEAVESRIPEYA